MTDSPRFRIRLGVRGAYRVTERGFDDFVAADAAAERWSLSNSTGEYWAQVLDRSGEVVRRFNLGERRLAR